MSLIIDAYLKEHGFTQHLLDSYQHFITVVIPDVIAQQKKLNIGPIGPEQAECQLDFLKHEFVLPCRDDFTPLYPFEARTRNVNYSAPLILNIRMTLKAKGIVMSDVTQKVCIGHIPVMYKSVLCHLQHADDDVLRQHKESPEDLGGYFIIKGSEKIIISQERMAHNQICVFGAPTTDAADTHTPSTEPFDYFAEIRSLPEGFHKLPVQLVIKLYNKGTIASGGGLQNSGMLRVRLPYARSGTEVPLFILFYALGYTNDKAIFNAIAKHDDPVIENDLMQALLPSLDDALHSLQQDAPVAHLPPTELIHNALDFIGRKNVNGATTTTRTERIRITRDHLLRDIFPHLFYGINRNPDSGISNEDKLKHKAQYLGLMTQRLLLTVQKKLSIDNRDHMGYKRIETAGTLCATLFRINFRKFTADLKRHIGKSLDANKHIDLFRIVSTIKCITSGMVSAIATGNWSNDQSFNTNVGISQPLNRYNMGATLSHVRRVNNAVKREGKTSNPRHLHGSHTGVLCPAETPEGAQCGLVKTQTLASRISEAIPSSVLYHYLCDDMTRTTFGIVDYFLHPPGAARININGAWVLSLPTASMLALVQRLKQLRRLGDLHHDVGIYYNITCPEIYLWTDAGRLMRPLLIANQRIQPSNMDWKTLSKRGIVEFVDVMETENLLIALSAEDVSKPNVTHMEIKSSALLSVAAGLIPFSNHNQSPRNVYSSAMSKQAMGVPLSNYQFRSDANLHLLHYPQKPIVYTKTNELTGLDETAYGCNAIVAIACFTGFNQEDSIIANQSSIDRGLFRSTSFKTHIDTEKRESISAQEQKWALKDQNALVHEAFSLPTPENTMDIKKGSFRHIDADALPSPGCALEANDVIIGKTTNVRTRDRQNPHYTKRDTSTLLKASDAGIVDRVTVSSTNDNVKSAKITIRSHRIPEVGDKLSSRHGQKGTLGATYRQEDMPFTSNGMVPDLIINPNAIPSRMTIGHLLETLLGKQAALDGEMKEATMAMGASDKKHTVASIAEALEKHHYQHRGFEIMYNPHTGRKWRASVYIGPIYYLKLKHMVQDKLHSRAKGQLQMLTKQPVEGRAKDGGLRFGEMERDCIISHGAAAFLKDRLMDNSDAFTAHICNHCGLFAKANYKDKVYKCSRCNDESQNAISKINLPYGFKLLVDELGCMNIAARLSSRTREMEEGEKKNYK